MILWKKRAAALALALAMAAGAATAALAEDDAPEAWDGAESVAQEDGAWAQPASAYQLRAPIFVQTQVLDLPRNTTTFWFALPAGTVLGQDSSLNLHLTVTDTLINERSSITFAVNGEQVETIHILDIVDNETGWWRVQIPAGLLRVDGTLNAFTITTAQRSIEGDCADIDNPANWVKLHDDSYVEVGVEEYGALTLDNVLETFYNSLTDPNRLATEFVLPSFADETAVAGLLDAASAVGAAYPYKDTVTFSVAEGTAQNSALQNQVYLGFTGGWPLGELPPLAAGQGYAAVAGGPEAGALLLTGADADGMRKALRFFAGGYMGQASGTALTLDTAAAKRTAESPANREGYYTLADFGYTTASLAGAFHQTVSYTLPQPNGLQSGERSYVEIHFRHSEALVSDNSLMTVYINDEPIASVKLSSSNAQEGKVKASIPADALMGETLTLRVDCYNYLGKVDCSKDYYDTAWTVIDEDSVVYLEPGDAAVRPTLRSFPLFTGGGEGTDVVCSLPEGATQDTLALAATLAARAGQNSKAALEWALPQALEPKQQQADLVFLGDSASIALPEEVRAALAVAPDGSGGYTAAPESGIVPETLADKIVFQVLRSPWNFDRRIYVLTYAPGMEQDARALLEDKQSLQTLTGQVAVADAAGRLQNFTLADAAGEAEAVPLTPERLAYLVERATGLSLWLLGVIALAVAAAIVLIVRALRNKSRFTEAAHAMSVEQQLGAAQQPAESQAEETETEPQAPPEGPQKK